MGFQTQVYQQPAPGIEGDWCDANPRHSLVAGPGGLVAGPNGVTVGKFGWANGNVFSNSGGVGELGFVHREQQALMTPFLAGSSMVIPPGLGMTAMVRAGVWARFAGGAAVGQKVYAQYGDGSAYAAATGTPPTALSATGSIAANVLNVSAIAHNAITSGHIDTNVLTVTTLAAGSVLGAGQGIGGVGVAANTTIVKQLTGTAGSTGTYQVNVSQTVGAEAMTVTGGGLTVTSLTSGAIYVGQGITTVADAGTIITGFGTGAGGAGTYTVNIQQTHADTSTAVLSGGTLTVTALASGSVTPGSVLTGAGVTSGNQVLAAPAQSNFTGVGGLGTYLTTVGDTVGSEGLAAITGVETNWVVVSAAAAGEVAKITTAY
jgi:hypothetical protein